MNKNLVQDPVFTDEAVKLTGKSRTNLYYYINSGEIPSYTLQIEGYLRKRRVFERAELMAWIAKQEKESVGV